MRVFDQLFEALHQLLLVFGGEVGIDNVLAVFVMLEFFDNHFEGLMVFAFALLDAEDDVAIHLDKAAVAVPGEALVLGGGGEGFHGLIVEAEVEDGVHHAGHGVAGTGADGDEEGEALGITELVAHDFFHVLHAGFHLALEGGRIGFFVGVEIGADFRSDREAGRDGEADAGHLGQVGAFAAEEGLHGAVAVRFVINPRCKRI